MRCQGAVVLVKAHNLLNVNLLLEFTVGLGRAKYCSSELKLRLRLVWGTQSESYC